MTAPEMQVERYLTSGRAAQDHGLEVDGASEARHRGGPKCVGMVCLRARGADDHVGEEAGHETEEDTPKQKFATSDLLGDAE